MTWNIDKVKSLSRAEQSRAEQSIVVLGNFMDLSNKTYAGYRVYDVFGISPSICASGFKRDIFVLAKGNK